MTENPPPLTLPRRGLLAAGAGVAATASLSAAARAVTTASERVFRHGVASGDPCRPRRAVDPGDARRPARRPGSGVGPRVEVAWEVAADRAFDGSCVAARSSRAPAATTRSRSTPSGCAPGRWYFYRFRLDGAAARSAAPAPRPRRRADVAGCASAWSSCSNSRPATSPPTATSPRATTSTPCSTSATTSTSAAPATARASVRTHARRTRSSAWPTTGSRHAQYKTDPDLQALHARYPFVVTWDDHEVANDAWRGGRGEPPARRGRLPARARPAPTGVRRVDAGAAGRHRRDRRRDAALPAAHVRARSPTSTCSTCARYRDSRSDRGAARCGRSRRRPTTRTGRSPAPADGLAQGGAAARARPVEAHRQPGDDRAAVLRPARRATPSVAINEVTGEVPRGRGADQPRPVGRLHRRPARALSTTWTARHRRHGVPDRRHPLGLGQRPAARHGHLPGDADVAVELVCTSVTSTTSTSRRAPPRTATVAIEAALQANNRH